jgi:hypothetical protein
LINYLCRIEYIYLKHKISPIKVVDTGGLEPPTPTMSR